MTAHTPIYNIPVPDSNTLAYQLGNELYAMGLGVESALQAASIPPATNSNIKVAASAAARDAAFGVPSTSAAQLALQATGALAIRTDVGVIERYFALYNASTNPGGAVTAGWYPTAGNLPFIRLTRGASMSLPAGTVSPVTTAFQAPQGSLPFTLSGTTYSNDHFSFDTSTGIVLCKLNGRYDVAANFQWSNGGSASSVGLGAVSKNTTSITDYANLLGRSDAATNLNSGPTVTLLSNNELLRTTDAVRLLVGSLGGGSTTVVGANTFPSSLSMFISYRSQRP